MRVLDKSNVVVDLDKLGHGRRRRATASSAPAARPTAPCSSTGPTGSGKSTTLYAALQMLNTPEKNIITVEDPVEYEMAGLTQVQVSTKAGLTFAAGLRAMVRADPDVIMVGEIRDRETAQIAVESALTGHLVLSTLHTNDAPSAITRLIEMGDRAVPRRLGARVHRRAAPRAAALPALQAAHDHPGEGAARKRLQGARRARGLRAGRLPALRRQRLPRAHRALRGDDDVAGDPDDGARTARRAEEIRDVAVAPGHDAAARRRPAEGPQGRTSMAEIARVIGIELACARRRRHALDRRRHEQTFVHRRTAAPEMPLAEPMGAHGHRFRRSADGGRQPPRLRPAPQRRRAPDGSRARPPDAARGLPEALRDRHARDRLLDPHRRPAPAPGDQLAARLRLLDPRPRPLPCQRLLPARRDRRGLPPDPLRPDLDRRARPARRRARVHAQAARLRARDRPDRLGQVHLAGGDDRRDQLARARSTS